MEFIQQFFMKKGTNRILKNLNTIIIKKVDSPVIHQQSPQQIKLSKKQDSVENGRQKENNVWQSEQLERLGQLYNQYGPQWSFFSQKFKKRSRINLKNKFNSCIRWLIKKTYSIQKQVTRRNGTSITFTMINIMLNFVNQLQKKIKNNGVLANPKSKIFRFKHLIIKHCFSQDGQQEQLYQLVRLTKQINSKLRSFGVYKTKNPSQWKMSEKNFKAVCEFDDVIKDIKRQEDEGKTILMHDQNYKKETVKKQEQSTQKIVSRFNLEVLLKYQ